MSLGRNAAPGIAQGVIALPWLKDNASAGKVTLSGSQTLISLFGIGAFHADARGVLIVNRSGGDIHYNPTGAATAANFTIADGESFTIWGGPRFLLGVRLFAAPAGGLIDLLELIEV